MADALPHSQGRKPQRISSLSALWLHTTHPAATALLEKSLCRDRGRMGRSSMALGILAGVLATLQLALYPVISARISGSAIEKSIESGPVQLMAASCLGILSIALLDSAFDVCFKLHQELPSKLWFSLPTLVIIVVCLGGYHSVVSVTLFACVSKSADFIILCRALLDLTANDSTNTWNFWKAAMIFLFFTLQDLEYIKDWEPCGHVIRIITFIAIALNSCWCFKKTISLRGGWNMFTGIDIHATMIMAALCFLHLGISILSPAVIRFGYFVDATSAYISIQLATRIIFIVLAIHIPSLLQKMNSLHLEHDLSMKATFVRYLSHEIRYRLCC